MCSMSVTRKRKDFEAAIIANKWEDLRPCYKNDDVSPKIIEMVLSLESAILPR